MTRGKTTTDNLGPNPARGWVSLAVGPAIPTCSPCGRSTSSGALTSW